MKELFVQFNFNVRVEVEDIDDSNEIKDAVIEWWTNTTDLPDYEILEEEG
tara:strand:+ start:664 stop:813 length:150 start_codon:yes stop_codon:yes gene_type:complete